MNFYLSSLQAMEYLLNRVDEKYWRDRIAIDIAWWNDRKNTSLHLNAYGGMGSFNDLVICNGNGHKIDKHLDPWIDVLFNWLKSICYHLAKNPNATMVSDGSKKKVEYHNAPLSAFTSIVKKELIENNNSLRGWRCLNCGFSAIDQVGIDYYIARSILPKILFNKFIKHNLISIIDNVFNYDIPGRHEIDLWIKKLIKKSSVNFIPEIENCMQPCPSCSYDKMGAIQRWAVHSNKLIPTSNQLLSKEKKNFKFLNRIRLILLKFFKSNHFNVNKHNSSNFEPIFQEEKITWLEPWYSIVSSSGNILQKELQKELSSAHPLYHLNPKVIARCDSTDDIFVSLNTNKFAIIHLTWIGKIDQEPRKYPTYHLYNSLTEFSYCKVENNMNILTKNEIINLSFPDTQVKDMNIDLSNQTAEIQTTSGYLSINNGIRLGSCKIILNAWESISTLLYQANTNQWKILDNVI